MKILITVYFLLFIVLSPLKALGTTPTISNVSGAVANQQILTITGSNMVNEDTTNWEQFFKNHPNASSFEGATPASDGWPTPGGYFTAVYDNTFSILGSQSARFRVHGAANCDNKGGGRLTAEADYYNQAGCTGDVYIRNYVSYDMVSAPWPNNFIKFMDSGNLCSPAHQYYFQPAGTTDGSLPTNWQARYDNTIYSINNPAGQIQNRRWYCVELHWKTTSPARFTVWIDGVQLHDGVPSIGTYGLSMIAFGIINECGTTDSSDIYSYQDGFVVSSSRVYPASLIQIGNSSTYGSGSEVTQEALKIADGTIQIKANLKRLGTGPYYLWVTNNKQERSQPYLLQNLNKTQADTTPPARPTGLKIIQ